jgi:adenosylcobinamide-phosphate guanylyltransferase
MQVVALIMAGGKGLRFSGDTEKPMATLMGKALITHVIEAAKNSKRICDVYVAVTSISPKTAQEAKKQLVNVIETAGNGYHADLQQAVKEANITGPVLIISSDLPLVTGEFLDEIISKYEASGKEALTVLVPKEAFTEYGMSAVSPYEHEGRMYAVSGINIIDGNKIDEEQEQEVVVSSRPEAVFNVNSSKDLELAKQFLNKSS